MCIRWTQRLVPAALPPLQKSAEPRRDSLVPALRSNFRVGWPLLGSKIRSDDGIARQIRARVCSARFPFWPHRRRDFCVESRISLATRVRSNSYSSCSAIARSPGRQKEILRCARYDGVVVGFHHSVPVLQDKTACPAAGRLFSLLFPGSHDPFRSNFRSRPNARNPKVFRYRGGSRNLLYRVCCIQVSRPLPSSNSSVVNYPHPAVHPFSTRAISPKARQRNPKLLRNIAHAFRNRRAS
jgi:hypothetical protein